MITKLGAAALAEESKPGLLPNAALALAGAGVVHGQVAKDNKLTGRKLLYHGTHPHNVESIKNNGLFPTTEHTAKNTNVLKTISREAFESALGKSYLTPDKLDAAGYAAGAQTRPVRNPNEVEVLREFLSGKNIVRANVPVWKMKTVRNPETAMGFEAWRARLGLPALFTPESQLRDMFSRMDNSTVIDGEVPAEYIKGKKYKSARPGEILSYIKNNKLRALKGYGLAGLGAGAVYLGGRNIYNRYAKDYE